MPWQRAAICHPHTRVGGKPSCRICLHLFLHIHMPLPFQKPRVGPRVLTTSTWEKNFHTSSFIVAPRRVNSPDYLTRRANFQRVKVAVGVQIENAYLSYVAHWFEKKKKKKSFIWWGVEKWWLKCFIFAPIQRTDWTPQRRPVTACQDFLKLIEKIKHFLPFLIASHSASALIPALSVLLAQCGAFWIMCTQLIPLQSLPKFTWWPCGVEPGAQRLNLERRRLRGL